MPYKDKEKAKEYLRLYRIANKEKTKEYCEANKEKKKEYDKTYNKTPQRKQKKKERLQLWAQTPQGKKFFKMNSWRNMGVNDVNDEMYDKYINTHCCDVCSKDFKDSRDRCLDHDHDTGDFRQILCRACNTMDKWKNYI
tara:strand:+ start:84 stop:500 length:417 start_codon:yes stop_codon:yes gene_type:complete